LSNLDGISSSSFSNVIGDTPQTKSVITGWVISNSANSHWVEIAHGDLSWVFKIGYVILEHNSFGLTKNFPGFISCKLVLELNED
jgi:hypothetical protein